MKKRVEVEELIHNLNMKTPENSSENKRIAKQIKFPEFQMFPNCLIFCCGFPDVSSSPRSPTSPNFFTCSRFY